MLYLFYHLTSVLINDGETLWKALTFRQSEWTILARSTAFRDKADEQVFNGRHDGSAISGSFIEHVSCDVKVTRIFNNNKPITDLLMANML